MSCRRTGIPSWPSAVIFRSVNFKSNRIPGVYDGATAEFRDICNYWQVENMGFVSAKIDEQKTEETKQKVVALVGKI